MLLEFIPHNKNLFNDTKGGEYLEIGKWVSACKAIEPHTQPKKKTKDLHQLCLYFLCLPKIQRNLCDYNQEFETWSYIFSRLETSSTNWKTYLQYVFYMQQAYLELIQRKKRLHITYIKLQDKNMNNKPMHDRTKSEISEFRHTAYKTSSTMGQGKRSEKE